MEVHQHSSSILGYVNLCKIFQRIWEAWECTPVDLKLGKMCSPFVPNNITISQLYPLNGFQIIFCHCVKAKRIIPALEGCAPPTPSPLIHPCQASSFASVYAERPGPNVDILIFHLGLKTVCIPVSGFSFVVLSRY